MKKITLLLAFVAIAGSSFGQAKKQVSFGLVGLSYEIPISAAITIAPTAFTNFDFDYLVLGVKGNYYLDETFGLPDAWDVYGGANLGFGVAISDNVSSDLDFGFQVGGRWYWSEKWGVYGEVGGGKLAGGNYGIGVTMVL